MVVGAAFVRKTAKNDFLHMKDCYSTMRFKPHIVAGDKHSSINPYFTSRLHNALVQGLEKCSTIPKMVIVVLEDDLIHHIGEVRESQEYYKHYIEAIYQDFAETCKKLHTMMPTSSKRENWPKIIMIEASIHRYYKNIQSRKDFNEEAQIAAKKFQNIWSVALKQIWNEHNLNLYRFDEQKFTGEGLCTFWKAVDRTIMFCDKKISRFEAQMDPYTQLEHSSKMEYEVWKQQKWQEHRASGEGRTTPYNNRFSWQRRT